MKVFLATLLFASCPINILSPISIEDIKFKIPSKEVLKTNFLNRNLNKNTESSETIEKPTLESFLKNQGVQLLATLAHPTNTYKRGEFSISESEILVNIYYEHYTTKLSIKKTLGFFTSIEVLDDDDYIKPFTAVEAIKNIIIRLLKSEKGKKKKTEFEKQTNKLFKDMSGSDLACLALTLEYWGN